MRGVAITVAFALAGCSIFNEPDRGLIHDSSFPDVPIDRRDAGDADADVIDDGGNDADAVRRIEDCDHPGDENDNRLADCDDYACAGLAQCCAEGSAEVPVEEDWSGITDWSHSPTSALPPTNLGNKLVFNDDASVAFVRNACQPLALGANIEVTLVPTACSDCDTSSFSALVLTAAYAVRSGERLPADLAIELHNDGTLSVTQAGDSIGFASLPAVPVGQPATIALEVRPSLDEANREVLVASAVAAYGGTTHPLLDSTAFLLRRDLIRDDDCAAIPGLNIAIEGAGGHVEVRTLKTTNVRCANPSHFSEPTRGTTTFTSETLGFPEWAAGGVAQPGLIGTRAGGYELFVDASRVSRRLELFGDVQFAIGHAGATSWDSLTAAMSATTPKIGCTEAVCAMPSLREPSALPIYSAPTSSRISYFLIAVAQDTVDSSVHELAIYKTDSIGTSVEVPLSDRDLVIHPDEGSTGIHVCSSLRDPLLLPADVDEYWLLYTCEEAAPSGIHAIRLELTPEGSIATLGEPIRVLDPAALGEYAAGGVRGAEAIVDERSDGRFFRVWFLARDRGGAHETIALASGLGTTPMSGDITGFPELTPYPGNPLLAPDAPALGPCDGGCSFEGFSVTRTYQVGMTPPALSPLVRFAVARQVNSGDQVRFEIIPLEQALRVATE